MCKLTSYQNHGCFVFGEIKKFVVSQSIPMSARFDKKYITREKST